MSGERKCWLCSNTVTIGFTLARDILAGREQPRLICGICVEKVTIFIDPDGWSGDDG